MAKFKKPPISVAQQYFSLKHSLYGTGKLSHGLLTWKYETQPTPLSRIYTILLTYNLQDAPKVYVVSPDLKELVGNRVIPHLYDRDKFHLCLYLPGSNQWNNHLYISNTIIPWASLWLFFFEEWLFSNKWKGGGKHPVIENKDS